MEILLGIVIGWLIPRPAIVGNIERRIWEPIKEKFPGCRKWFG